MSWRVSILVYLMVVFTCAIVAGTDVERRLTTVYDIHGRPVDQSEDNPGLHYVSGSTTLSSGVDTLNLNTSTATGEQKVSFLSKNSYHGAAISTNPSDTDRYWVIPLSGTEFIVRSSDATDTSLVNFFLEGQ